MKKHIKLSIIIPIGLFILGCQQNHNGLYVANKSLMGITPAWEIDGEKLTVFTLGMTEKFGCKQFPNKIELSDGKVLFFNNSGELIINDSIANPYSILGNYKMIKISNKTNQSPEDIKKAITQFSKKGN